MGRRTTLSIPLDADFLDVAMNIDPREKMIVKGPGVSKEDTRIEKTYCGDRRNNLVMVWGMVGLIV